MGTTGGRSPNRRHERSPAGAGSVQARQEKLSDHRGVNLLIRWQPWGRSGLPDVREATQQFPAMQRRPTLADHGCRGYPPLLDGALIVPDILYSHPPAVFKTTNIDK
jgi:hypothetical protein